MSKTGAAPTRRVNRGRGHSYYLDGEKVIGVTTALNAGYPKKALIGWAAEATAGYAVDHWADLEAMTLSKRMSTLIRARFEVQDEAKVRGTQVHAYAQRLAAGEALDVPEELVGHVDAYLDFARDWLVRELMVEQPVYSREHRYAGTPDLVAMLADERVWLIDYKTGAKGGVYLDHVLQLAALRFAEFTLDVDGNEVKLPPIEACGVVWLRADGYDLIPVEADEQAFELFLCAKRLGEYDEGDRGLWIADALLPPARRAGGAQDGEVIF